MTEELKKEILNILDNVYYWETCPQEYNDRIDAVKKQLTIPVVISCFYCKEDLKSDEIEVNNRVKYEEKTCRKCYSKHNL